MIESNELLLKRIDELLITTAEVYSKRKQNTICDENSFFKSIYGTISLLKTTYGEN